VALDIKVIFSAGKRAQADERLKDFAKTYE
jgi:hypothetical protein